MAVEVFFGSDEVRISHDEVEIIDFIDIPFCYYFLKDVLEFNIQLVQYLLSWVVLSVDTQMLVVPLITNE